MTPRLAVLLSGSGRTLLNLHERIRAGQLHAQIPLVIASRPCLGAERARDLDLPTLVLPGDLTPDTLHRHLADARADLVVLAGYLRRLPIPPAYQGRILNIHPALLSIRNDGGLPRFGGQGMYGDRVHAAVLHAHTQGQCPESGCTVHLVDDEYDHGPTLLERRCPVLPDDTVQTLAARVFELEKDAYPEAIAAHLAAITH